MKEVQARLRQKNHQVKPDWPGLTTVQIELKKVRKPGMDGEPTAIDRPWSLGRLTKYYIPPEAVPKALEIQEVKGRYEPLTIRQVKWVGRLHAATQDIMELAIWSLLYAEREAL
jgi:hypothetical protein